MKYAITILFALAVGVTGCGSNTPAAQGPGECKHCKDGHHCEKCEKGEPCEQCQHGDACEHCKNKMAGAPGHPEHAGHGEHGDNHEHGEHHHDFPGPIGEFHAILSPIWHSPEGADRQSNACKNAQAMHDKAVAIEAMTPPAGAKPEDFKAAAKELTASVDKLSNVCQMATIRGADTELKPLHEAFHKVAEMGEPIKH